MWVTVVDANSNLLIGEGEFGLYGLEKRGLETQEAITIISRQWGIDRHDIGFGGLKDKKGVTQQYITVRGGVKSDFKVLLLNK